MQLVTWKEIVDDTQCDVLPKHKNGHFLFMACPVSGEQRGRTTGVLQLEAEPAEGEEQKDPLYHVYNGAWGFRVAERRGEFIAYFDGGDIDNPESFFAAVVPLSWPQFQDSACAEYMTERELSRYRELARSCAYTDIDLPLHQGT